MTGLSFVEKVKMETFQDLADSDVILLLERMAKILNGLGTSGYIVGGFIRDTLLGRITRDIDIAVDSDALGCARCVADALNSKYVPLDEEFGIARVVLSAENDQWQLDFSTFGGSIEQDLARRDFTIDAMAIDIDCLGRDRYLEQIVDPFNGRDDLAKGIVRSVDDYVFEADAIRLLRAVRLAAELGFSLDHDTEMQVCRDAHLVTGVAGERVREELLRLLKVPGSGRFIRYLDTLGLLTALVPELMTAKGVMQPREHYWDVFEHSLETVKAVDFILRQGDWEHASDKLLEAVPWSEELERHFGRGIGSGSTDGALLKLAALLHDVAKPGTKTIEPDGRMRFLGHAQDGALMAVDILGRLRFSTKETRLVETMIRHHLRPVQMSQEGLPTRRAVYRFFRDTAEAGFDTLFLSLADHLAARGPALDEAEWQEHTRIVEYVISQYHEQQSKVSPVKLIDGHDLINIFGLAPGPGLGELLEAVREAHAAGELTDREEAIKYIRNYLSAKDGK